MIDLTTYELGLSFISSGFLNESNENDKDISRQLNAIKRLLRMHGAKSRDLRKNLKNNQVKGEIIDDWDQLYHDIWGNNFLNSIYDEAAFSMSAVGMLAPFVESMMHSLFINFGKEHDHSKSIIPQINVNRISPQNGRPSNKRWDVRYFYDDESGKYSNAIAKGIIQLSEITKIIQQLTSQEKSAILLLFEYRHFMFHNGFEWPQYIKNKFLKKCTQYNWSAKWYTTSKQGKEPHIFYITEDFVEEILELITKYIDGCGLIMDAAYSKPTS